MNRPLETWKLCVLSLLFGAPIGYWLASSPSATHSPVYAQQVTDAQSAKNGLELSASVASADQLSKVFRDVSKSLKPSVVSIKNIVEQRVRVGRSRSNLNIPPELEQLFGSQANDFESDSPGGEIRRGRVDNGLGSGVIVREDGYILTNNHVVKGASVLEVVLSDDRKMEAKVIGTDERTDLAVLKIDATGLVAAKLGSSGDMEVGDWVIAIGSPFGLAQTVTAGIVSATNRNDQGITLYDNFIQTDAAINPGNSGGPLLNLRGEVIGINTAIASRSGGYNGICFAVPSDTAQRILGDLISKGRVTRGFIGVAPETLTPEIAQQLSLPPDLKGALVTSVTKNMPADKAGIQRGDVITAINNKPVISGSDMRRAIGESKPGSQVRVTIMRDNKPNDLLIQVGELDEQALAASMESREILGIQVGEVSEETREEFGLEAGEGVEVKGINRRSPLATRIPPGVVILSVNGKKVNSVDEFSDAVERALTDGSSGQIKMVIRDAESDKMFQIRIR
jgi:serine protease Do